MGYGCDWEEKFFFFHLRIFSAFAEEEQYTFCQLQKKTVETRGSWHKFSVYSYNVWANLYGLLGYADRQASSEARFPLYQLAFAE